MYSFGTECSETSAYNNQTPLIVRINQALDLFAQVIQNIPCANLEFKNYGGVSPEFASTAVKFCLNHIDLSLIQFDVRMASK